MGSCVSKPKVDDEPTAASESESPPTDTASQNRTNKRFKCPKADSNDVAALCGVVCQVCLCCCLCCCLAAVGAAGN